MLLTEYLSKMREKVKAAGMPQVAIETGLPVQTIYRFVAGFNCTEKTMVAVEAALKRMEKKK